MHHKSLLREPPFDREWTDWRPDPSWEPLLPEPLAWRGMGADAGRRIMDRLEAMTRRTLVDVLPVYPADPLGMDEFAWLAPPTIQDPVALRVEQTLADGATRASTTFAMRKRMGCWWVTF